MKLEHYIANLREHMMMAAEIGGEETQAVAERLMGALESATRIALLEALSAAAADITSEIAPSSVTVTLQGSDPEFEVSLVPFLNEAPVPQEPEQQAPQEPSEASAVVEDGTSTRTTVRIPESLKAHIDSAAAREGISVNAWIIRAAYAALDSGSMRTGSVKGPQRFTGWV